MNKFLILVALLGFFSAEVTGQIIWEQTGGPRDWAIYDFARDSAGRIWTVIDGIALTTELYRSNEDGKTWQKISVPGSLTLQGIEVAPNGSIWCFDNDNKVIISSGGGNTWSAKTVASGPFGPNRILFLDNGNSLYLSNAGIMESFDGGQNWGTKSFISGVSLLNLFEKAPNGDIWLGVKNNSTGDYELRRSTDSGESFSTVFTDGSGGLPFYEMAFLPGAVLFAGENGIFKSSNGGQTWGQVFDDGFVNTLAVSAGGTLYGCKNPTSPYGHFSIIKSEDGGTNWTVLPSSPGVQPYAGKMAMTPSGAIILADGAVIWRTADGGQSWAQTSPYETVNNHVKSIAVNPVSKVVHASNKWGVFTSGDNGQTWKTILPPNADYPYALPTSYSFSADGRCFYIKSGRLLRSENDGTTWDTLPLPPGLWPSSVATSPGGKIFVTNPYDSLLYSPDAGLTWEVQSTDTYMFDLLAANDSLVFAKINSGGFFRSLDDGKTWEELNYPFVPSTGWNRLYWTAWGELFADFEDKLFRSPNLGSTWSKVDFDAVNGSLLSGPGGDLHTTADGKMILWEESQGLYYSDDFGWTWTNPMQGGFLGNTPLVQGRTCALSEGQYLFMGTNYGGVWRTSSITQRVAKITGQIQKDQNDNCQIDTSDLPLQNWLIQATDTANHTAYATTDPTGHYRLGFIIPDSTSTDLTLKTLPPNQLWQPCDSTQTVTVTPQDDTKTGIDFPMDAVVDCPLLDVSASFWPARPCFPLTVGAEWCNLGTLPALDSRLYLKLDPLISVDSASMPIAAQNGDTLEFLIGNVALNQCGSVRVYGHLSCDAAIGQAICVSAKVTPDTICAAFPAWSGATLHATAHCVGDSVVDFTIKNIGDAPSTNGLEYVVIEDQVLLFTGQVPSLAPGQEIPHFQPADGSTYRLQGEQEPGHPVSNFYAAWQEGCGTPPLGQPQFGWITPFLGEDGDPFSDDFCREATASYDPNLKEALPVGYGAEHFISPNQAIDYFLHFQNTGTDTAFQVVLRDTILPLLDLASLRVGAASHTFSYEIYGDGILKFIFKNILLPDSNINEPASHGWVNFQIGQKKDLPLGSVIRNHAGIYFDFNAPVLTNETWHTLGENFILLDWKNPSGISKNDLKIYPNPMTESVVFDLQNIDNEGVAIEISMPDGRTVRRLDFSKQPFLMKRGGLPSGVYFFKISTKNGSAVGEGKLLVR